MAVTQYIGARYVPDFASPIEWNDARTYDPLTIVTHQGNSYTSRQFVPLGVNIDNEDFWALTGNYNAQVEQYRQEVQQLGVKVDGAVHAYDTVADMKADPNLQAGMTCHTNGFHAVGDGGAAWYIISENGTANEMDVLTCENGVSAVMVVTECLRPEMLGALGDGISDETKHLQRGLELGSIIADKQYLVSIQDKGYALDVPGNRKLTINGIIRLSKNHLEAYSIINVEQKSNIVIDGIGSIIGDKAEHTGTRGEWGHCVNVLASENIRIKGVSITNAWGDGVYIGSKSGAVSKKIFISNCNISNNSRNNISLVGLDTGIIESCILNDADRISPKSGMDIEPNANGVDYVTNVKVSNCISYGNQYSFICSLYGTAVVNEKIWFDSCQGEKRPLLTIRKTNSAANISFTNTTIKCKDYAFELGNVNDESQIYVDGRVELQGGNQFSIIAENLTDNTIKNITAKLFVSGANISRIAQGQNGQITKNVNVEITTNTGAFPNETSYEYECLSSMYVKWLTEKEFTDETVTLSSLGGTAILKDGVTNGVVFRNKRIQRGTTFIIVNKTQQNQTIRALKTDQLSPGHIGVYKAVEYSKLVKLLDVDATGI